MKPDRAFLADFDRQDASVDAVGRLLVRAGYSVFRPQSQLRPTAEVRRLYADCGDLIVRKRVEVKHRKIDFTCEDEFPFSTVFIDECYHVDRFNPNTLDAYYIVNAKLTHAAVIRAFTRKWWKVESNRDPAQDRVCDFYAMPKWLIADWVRFDG